MGGGKHPPLTPKEVKEGLKRLGFAFKAQKGSHEQWQRIDPPHDKVTVDCPKAPFKKDLINFMAGQAKVSRQEFFDACLERGIYAQKSPAGAEPDTGD